MDVDLKQLQEDVERLTVMTLGLSANYEALRQMVFGVYRSILTPDEYKTVYTKFVDALESESNKAVEALQDFVSSSRLLNERLDVHLAMSQLKRDPDYISDSASKH